MITPTLFNIAAIIGLSPIGETFDPNKDADNFIDFDVKHANFSKYINFYHSTEEEVSEVEHIAFLALWLSKYVFCRKFLQVASRFITLANHLHHGRRVCISKLLLVSL